MQRRITGLVLLPGVIGICLFSASCSKTDPEVITEVEQLGIQVITWKQFRELHAAGKLVDR